jgi:pyruvate ferredoxin oxidoreductase alpha subunit
MVVKGGLKKTDYVARTGNEAMAEAMRQINPDVVAAYPITPATEIVQIFSGYIADGLADTEFITVESEHSAMSACIGASAAGARVMTATSSQGLILMAEILYIAAGLRCPIILAEVNRALSAPINIHCDHSDTMAVRDAGWIQLYAENAQEAYDDLIQAVRIGEDPEVRLPVMVSMDGFIISHGFEVVQLLQDEVVQRFVGPYKPTYSLLEVENPITIGALDFTDFYFEHRRQLADAMEKAKKVISEVGREFGVEFGRSYGFFEDYKLKEADYVIIAIGSTAGTAKVVVDELRNRGVKAGLLKLRVFRPFPVEELKEVTRNIKAIAVLDRADTLSTNGGPLFQEVSTALYEEKTKPKMINYLYGLGGRDITPQDLEAVYKELLRLAAGEGIKKVQYLGVRE